MTCPNGDTYDGYYVDGVHEVKLQVKHIQHYKILENWNQNLKERYKDQWIDPKVVIATFMKDLEVCQAIK